VLVERGSSSFSLFQSKWRVALPERVIVNLEYGNNILRDFFFFYSIHGGRVFATDVQLSALHKAVIIHSI
jgi:hypothetical protein